MLLLIVNRVSSLSDFKVYTLLTLQIVSYKNVLILEDITQQTNIKNHTHPRLSTQANVLPFSQRLIPLAVSEEHIIFWMKFCLMYSLHTPSLFSLKYYFSTSVLFQSFLIWNFLDLYKLTKSLLSLWSHSILKDTSIQFIPYCIILLSL